MGEQEFRRAMLRWGPKHVRRFPWRESRDPYEILIGEILLQRTRGENVVPIFHRFMERWPEPVSLAAARTSSLSAVIRPLGLAKRAPLLKRLGRALASRKSVPLDPSALEELPAVGPYSAHAVPIFAANADLPLVDWVIARVLRRYFGIRSSKRPNVDVELWDLACRLAAKGRARILWLGTLDLAAEVCKPRPRCPICPLKSSCCYFLETRISSSRL